MTPQQDAFWQGLVNSSPVPLPTMFSNDFDRALLFSTERLAYYNHHKSFSSLDLTPASVLEGVVIDYKLVLTPEEYGRIISLL